MLKNLYDKFVKTSNLTFGGKYARHHPLQCRDGCIGEAPPTTCNAEIAASTPLPQKMEANGAPGVLPQCQTEHMELHGDVYEVGTSLEQPRMRKTPRWSGPPSPLNPKSLTQ
jgi:hypothetical protein